MLKTVKGTCRVREHANTNEAGQSYFEAIDTFADAAPRYRPHMCVKHSLACDPFLWARIHLLLCLAALAGIVTGCGERDSPGAEVRATIEQMEFAAEARDVSDVLELVSAQYRDDYGNGRDEVGRAVRGYFIANQTIHLLTRVEELSFPAEDEARATVLVGMVGRDAAAANAWNLAADLYRFEVAIVREAGEWKITWARWRRA